MCNVDYISYFLNIKRTRTPGMKMAVVKIQHKNCLQSTLRKKIINTLFAGSGLGRSVLGKNVPSVLGTAVLKTTGTVFPNTDLPAGKYIHIYIHTFN